MRPVRFFTIAVILAGSFVPIFAQDELPQKPVAWITDYTNTLSPVELGTINEQLSGLEQRSSNQIFIALFSRVPDGYYLEDFSVKLYEKWQPGLPAQDNGILMVIFVQDRKIRIEVGYGLEDVITDAQAGRLISDYIAPAFKANDYYGGLQAALDVLIPAVEDKYQIPRKKQQEDTGIPFSTIFIGIMLIIIISRMIRGPRSTGYGTRRRGGGLFFPGPIFGGFGSRGGGGGFGGGGFSGGFGGMSGGGGASGSW